ncbi:hypothetical protein EYZ11_008364 [Aspergillus tanneri]|uniref:Clr5 domain-containing protein n=1 Tax=Aspergillus tanneri TaxID=1220188 RepID=A0A4S3JCU4_9EURO|nr:hypothetical protein EYZ11_008364 [Aspergillus tanneri]
MSRGKQYKDRLAAWHIRKNIKTKAVQSMIRKQQKRLAQGKQTAFRDSIGSNRITGSISRYGTEWDKRPRDKYRAESPEPRTPSDMSCYTPEPDDRGATLTPLPEIQSEHPYQMKHLDPFQARFMTLMHGMNLFCSKIDF